MTKSEIKKDDLLNAISTSFPEGTVITVDDDPNYRSWRVIAETEGRKFEFFWGPSRGFGVKDSTMTNERQWTFCIEHLKSVDAAAAFAESRLAGTS